MQNGNMERRSSVVAPIDVDRDSDATLSSDSDVEMEDDADFVVQTVAPRLRTTQPRASTETATATPTFGQSMAAARADLLHGESMRGGGGSSSAQLSVDRREPRQPAVSMTTSNGKKRRLSPSPPRSERQQQKQTTTTSVLDFRLPAATMAVPRVERTTQLIDDDEEEEDADDEEEETKSNGGGGGYWSTQQPVGVGIGGAMNTVRSMRTWICGQWFGHCVLKFHTMYMHMSLWSLPTSLDGTGTKREFHGSIMCGQLNRFSLSQDEGPFFAILELKRGVDIPPSFGPFYDAIFAKATDVAAPSVVLPDIYGAVLFFEDDLELARCRSLGELSSTLEKLLDVPLSSTEASQVLGLRPPTTTNTSTSSTGVMGSLSTKLTGTFNALSQMFSHTDDRSSSSSSTHKTPKLRQTTLLVDATRNDTSDHESGGAMSSRFRTSSRRKSFLQQQQQHQTTSREEDEENEEEDDVEVVVQLHDDEEKEEVEEEKEVRQGDHDQAKAGPRPRPAATTTSSEVTTRRSMRGVVRLMEQHHKKETERLQRERKSKMLLLYPFDGADRSGQISINYGDIDRLKPGEFLNDTIIDFYMKYLWRHVEPWQQKQAYFFSSHFFTQLCGGSGKLSSGSNAQLAMTEERFSRVSRWTQKEESFFDKKFLFVPINDSCHWSIAVVCNPGSAIIHRKRKPSPRRQKKQKTSQQPPPQPPSQPASEQIVDVDDEEQAVIIDTTEDASESEDEEQEEEEEDPLTRQKRLEHPPCILFLDSLQCHPKKKIYTLLKSYLEYEYKARYDDSDAAADGGDGLDSSPSSSSSLLVTSFDANAIPLIEPEIPLQSNSSDCGVFLLMYSAQILQRFPLGICDDDVATKMVHSISKQMFDDSHVYEFRDYLHQLLFTLQRIDRRGGGGAVDELAAIRTEGIEFFAVES